MSQSAKIRRGTTPRHSRPQGRRPSMPPRVKASGVRALAALPVPVDQVRRWTWRILWLLIAVALIAGLYAMKLPQMLGTELGEGIGALGFNVRHVEITGIDRMDRLAVDSVALDQESTAMPLVDLALIRQKLLKYGWIEDARVSRRLPDTLLIDVVERQPAAIWQYQQKLNLVDKDGVILSPVDIAHMPDLPLVIGPDANDRVPALAALISATPSLKPMIEGASWVGGRRWDLRFHSGETLQLPEGDDAAKAALTKFVRLDETARLLGRGYVRFDMRVPGKFIVRVSEEPGREIGAPAPAKPATSTTPAAPASGAAAKAT